MFDLPDPITDIASLVLGKMKDNKIAQWLQLLFTLSFSATIAFLFTSGTVILSTRSALTGVASGMVSAAIVMLVVFQSSKLTKGMQIAVPKTVLDAEAQTSTQVIQK